MRIRREEQIDPIMTLTYKKESQTDTCTSSGTVITSTFTGSTRPRTWYRQMQDVVTPNFNLLSGQGKIINNPMYSIEEEVLDPPCAMHANLNKRRLATECNPDKYLYYSDAYSGERQSSLILNGYGFPYLDPPGVSVESLTNQALTQAWANVEDNNFTSLASLGELRATLTSIRDLGIRTFKFLRFLRQLDDGKAWKMYFQGAKAADIADRYMEVRYAIRPLVYEIKSLAQALSAPKFELNSRRTFRGYAADTDTIENTSTFSWADPSYDSKSFTGYRVSTREVSVRAGVLVTVKSSHWLDRWGFDDIIETAWELTKLSFAIDWFIGIGQKLAAWTPEFGLRPLASWIVVEDKTYQSSEITGSTRIFNQPGWTTLSASFGYTGCKMETTRIVRSRTPNPDLPIFPAIKVKLDLLKIADLLVILNQFRTK